MTPARSREDRPGLTAPRLIRCAHRNRDKGACCDCGHVFADPKPSPAPLTWRERRADDLAAMAEMIGRQRGVIRGLCDVVLFYRGVADAERYRLRSDLERARAAAAEREEDLSAELDIVLAGEAEAQWAVRVLAGRLDAALAALPALEAAAATGGRRDLAAALQPLAAALRGQRSGG